MTGYSVQCGCGRPMTVDTLRGRGAYRCGCGARVKVQESLADAERQDTCVWRTPDGQCQEVAEQGDLPISLCAPHANELITGVLGRVVSTESEPADYSLLQIWQSERSRVRTSGEPYVYYVRFGTRIKIGTSSNLALRLERLPHDEVLAVEPGSFELENQRHEQFADLRLTGEWFHAGEGLLRHVAAVRNEHGDPSAVTDFRPPLSAPATRICDASEVMLAAEDSLVTGPEAAQLCRVGPGTIRQWVSRGHLVPAAKDERGRNLFKVVDLAKVDFKTRRRTRRPA